MKNTLTKFVAGAGVVASNLYLVSAVMAQSASQYLSGVNSAGSSNLLDFVKQALNLVIALSALIAVGILVYSGIQYIVAAGDENKVEKATKGITYAIVGLVVCFISVLIVNFVLTNLLKA
jgi:hypothetical protein